MQNTTTIHACTECATAIVNDDYSHIHSTEEYETITAAVEAAGQVTLGEHVNLGGYFQCWFCDQTCIDDAFEFHGTE